jgi:hypothetical protein
MNPMTLEKFLRIKNKYGNHASWAIWADETDAPKSRMDEISFFDDPAIIKSLNNEIILVGLNLGAGDGITVPLSNFHSKHGADYKLRYALDGSKLWGSYMTDIIKDFPEVDSNKVKNFLLKNPDFIDHNIKLFEEEIEFIGSSNPKIYAFGGEAFNLVNKSLGHKYEIKKLIHYTHYISKENYKSSVIKNI